MDAGALPTLLPGGRPVDDVARAQLASSWGLADETALPATPGRDGAAILRAAAAGELAGLVVGGVELADLPDPVLARAALREADVVVSLEQVASEVTQYADVVLPVAPVINKSGTFRNWEGRDRRFATTIDPSGGSSGRVGGTAAITLPDCRVLDTLAVEMDVDLFTQTPEVAGARARPRHSVPAGRREIGTGARRREPARATTPPTTPTAACGSRPGASCSTAARCWSTSRSSPAPPARRRSGSRRSRPGGSGLVEDAMAGLEGPRGSLHLPVELADLPDDVVWAPARVPQADGGVVTLAGLGLTHGGPARLTGGTTT